MTSSPRFPKLNGFVERQVQIVKRTQGKSSRKRSWFRDVMPTSNSHQPQPCKPGWTIEQPHYDNKHNRKGPKVFQLWSYSWRVETLTGHTKMIVWQNSAWSTTTGLRINCACVRSPNEAMETSNSTKCTEPRFYILQFSDRSSKRQNRVQITEAETATYKQVRFKDHVTSLQNKTHSNTSNIPDLGPPPPNTQPNRKWQWNTQANKIQN